MRKQLKKAKEAKEAKELDCPVFGDDFGLFVCACCLLESVLRCSCPQVLNLLATVAEDRFGRTTGTNEQTKIIP